MYIEIYFSSQVKKIKIMLGRVSVGPPLYNFLSVHSQLIYARPTIFLPLLQTNFPLVL